MIAYIPATPHIHPSNHILARGSPGDLPGTLGPPGGGIWPGGWGGIRARAAAKSAASRPSLQTVQATAVSAQPAEPSGRETGNGLAHSVGFKRTDRETGDSCAIGVYTSSMVEEFVHSEECQETSSTIQEEVEYFFLVI
jgi:hypothetical protein